MADTVDQRGEIYFIREQDAPGSFTPFVKIGLVRDSRGRSSQDRLQEHQTGNPRRLHLDPASVVPVPTPAVDSVEAMLHRELATQRIQGEWFRLPTSTVLEAAIDRARALSADAADLMPVFAEAERLKKVASNGQSRDPSGDELRWHEEWAVATAQKALCQGLKARMTGLLSRAYEAGAPIEGAGTTQKRAYSPKFQEAAFMKAHPDLYERYSNKVEDWSGRFSLTKVEEVVVPPDVLGRTQSIERLLDDFEEGDDISQFNEPNLQLEQLKSLALWSEEVSKARLRVALGDFESITGVCRWKREMKLKHEFRLFEFACDHEDLVKEFTSDLEVRTYVQLLRTRTEPGATA